MFFFFWKSGKWCIFCIFELVGWDNSNRTLFLRAQQHLYGIRSGETLAIKVLNAYNNVVPSTFAMARSFQPSDDTRTVRWWSTLLFKRFHECALWVCSWLLAAWVLILSQLWKKYTRFICSHDSLLSKHFRIRKPLTSTRFEIQFSMSPLDVPRLPSVN